MFHCLWRDFLFGGDRSGWCHGGTGFVGVEGLGTDGSVPFLVVGVIWG